jgi:hypothetical protein
MFVVMYDLSDMPPNNRTFLRQRTMYVPTTNTNATSSIHNNNNNNNNNNIQQQLLKSYLRYLIHLR